MNEILTILLMLPNAREISYFSLLPYEFACFCQRERTVSPFLLFNIIIFIDEIHVVYELV